MMIMKRIYEQKSYGKELIGYDYKNYFIEIENEFNVNRNYLGTTKKWYHIILKSGEKWCSDILREVKEKIDEEMLEVK